MPRDGFDDRGMNRGAWVTPEIDARIVALRGEGVFLSVVCATLAAEFRVKITKGMLLRRTRTLRLTAHDRRSHTGAADPPAPGWYSTDSDDDFTKDWSSGVPSRVIAEKWGVSLDKVQRRRHRMNLPTRPGGPGAAAALPRPPMPKAEPVAAQPITYQPPMRPKSPSGRHGSSFMFRNLASPPKATVVWAPGECHWPLRCEEPAVGKFCARHGVHFRTK